MKKQPNRWLLFSSLAFQMGLLFWGAIRLGQYLDKQFQSGKIATLICCVVALVASLVLIQQQSRRL